MSYSRHSFPPRRNPLRALRAAATGVAVLVLAIVSCRDGPTEPPFELTQAIVPQTMTGGDGHSCGLTVSGAAYCWGRGDFGQRGDGTSTPTVTTPVPVAGGLVFESIHAAGFRTFALTPEGIAYAWGENGGMLGDGTTNFRYVPVRVAGGLTFMTLSAGYSHTVALTAGGVAYEWGYVDSGDPGDGSTTNLRMTPVPVVGAMTFQDIGVGKAHTVGLTSVGQVYAWGRNTYGQLGDGTAVDHYTPLPVAGDLKVARLSVGNEHAVVLTTSGEAYAWGRNLRGEIGDGTTTDRNRPVRVVGSLTFRFISAGARQSLGFTRSGDAFGWGANSFGQLGDGTRVDRHTPVRVANGLDLVNMNSGFGHSMGVSESGAGYAWGIGGFGQHADGTRTDRLTPTLLGGGLTFRK
jgi:alpha-tubulin suppressor-like RCC1 family protein